MKKEFFDYLFSLMVNPRIYVIFVGLGWPRYDEFKAKYPKRAINTEAAEQTALDIAVGLASQGMIPFVYTITPFYWRAAETLRLYPKYHLILCGAGRDDDYSKDDGFSHDASDIEDFMALLGIDSYWPNTNKQMRNSIDDAIANKVTSFISLIR